MIKHLILKSIIFCLLYIVFEVIFNCIENIIGKYNYYKNLKKPYKTLIGHTSLWMFLFGGVSYILIYFSCLIPIIKELPIFPIKMLMGCFIITGLELGGGMILNKIFKLNIWDYSRARIILPGNKKLPLNLFGQIDVFHSIGWFFIAWLMINIDKILTGAIK